MMTILRSHDSKISTNWSPDGALTGADVCMHAGFGPIRISQTTGSMVSVLKSGKFYTLDDCYFCSLYKYFQTHLVR